MRSLSFPRWLAIAFVIIGPGITPIGAVEALRHVLTPVADDCAKWLKGHKHSEERQPALLAIGKPNPRRGQPAIDLILVPAEGEAIIPGWILSSKKALGFKVTEYPRTAAALLARDNAPTGTITATFSAAWEKEAPADEPPVQRGPGDDGTGFGRSKEIDCKVVLRKVGAVRASVSVRYTQGKK